MSAQYYYDGLGKWVKGLPLVSKLSTLFKVEVGHSVYEQWKTSHSSWGIAFSKEFILHLSMFVYDSMKRCSLHGGADLSQPTEKLREFIQVFSVDGVHFDIELSHSDTGIAQKFQYLIVETAEKWSTHLKGKDYAQLWAAIKNETQSHIDKIVNDAVSKIKQFCKNSSDLACLQIDTLTSTLMKKTAEIITLMNDIFKEEILEVSWLVSSKLTHLLECILNLVETIFDYMFVMTFDFDIPLDIGWELLDVDELGLNNIGPFSMKRKRRMVGQH